MNLKTFIQCLLCTNIWPGKINKDGKLKFNVFNTKSLIYYCVWAVATGFFLWRYSIQLISKSEWSYVDYIMMFINNFPWLIAGFGPGICLSLKTFENWSVNSYSMNFSSNIVITILTLFLNLVFVIWQIFQTLDKDDAIIWIAMVTLMVPYGMSTIGVYTSPVVCIAMLKSEITAITKKQVSLRDIEKTMIKIETFSTFIAIPMMVILSTAQICIILSIYLSFINYMYANFIFLTLNIFLSLMKNFGDLEECYDLIKDLANKAREEACYSRSVKDMMRLMLAAGKLEGMAPFTSMKFFTLERSTLTAMLATTVTYLVVLYQTFSMG